MEDWRSNVQELELDKIKWYKITEQNKPISFRQFIEILKRSSTFRLFFNNLFSQAEFNAFFWEVRPVIKDQLDNDFEFVIIQNTALEHRKSDASNLEDYLVSDELALGYENLRKDTKYIIPTEKAASEIYNHLANFVRNVPEEQINQFWKKVAAEYRKSVSEQPVWLSTHGLEARWLHVRIDSKPRYYSYNDYRQ
ncbi:MAG: hypothetical protein AAGG68_08300 [Bacteroidota bacterium]